MTNKYLDKIALAKDESDAAKTFGKSWAASTAGHVVGGAIGGGLALLAAHKYKGFTPAVRKSVIGVRKSVKAVKQLVRGPKTTISAGYTGAEAKARKARNIAVGVGSVVGGLGVEDAANYASIRHDVKKQHRELTRTKTASENRYLSHILKTTKES